MRALSPELLELQAHPDALATVTVRCKRRSTFAGDPLLWRPAFKHTAANIPYGDVNVTAAACSCSAAGYVVRVLRSTSAKKVRVRACSRGCPGSGRPGRRAGRAGGRGSDSAWRRRAGPTPSGPWPARGAPRCAGAGAVAPLRRGQPPPGSGRCGRPGCLADLVERAAGQAQPAASGSSITATPSSMRTSISGPQKP